MSENWGWISLTMLFKRKVGEIGDHWPIIIFFFSLGGGGWLGYKDVLTGNNLTLT